MNGLLANHSIRRAAGLTVVALLAILLPAAQAQAPVAPAAGPVYYAYVPLVNNALPASRLYLPLCTSGSATGLDQSPGEASASGAAVARASRPGGLVTRQGEQLLLNGAAYTFVGTNVSYLAGPFFPESHAEEIVAHLAASGVQVIRVWVLPWNDLDRVERLLDLGRAYHVRFILTLQDFFGNLDGSCFGRYKTVDLPHIRNVVARFARRPEILMWELMNEPTCPANDSGLACWDALYKWAQVTSREIKRLDPDHLVAVGTQNAGFDDQTRGVFRRLHALDTIDLVSVHRSAGALPKQELAIAHELGKPVYFGEVYKRGLSESCEPLRDDALDRRAEAIATDLQASREAGVDGYLLWQFAFGGVDMGSHTEYFCGVYDYFRDDPVWGAIQAATP